MLTIISTNNAGLTNQPYLAWCIDPFDNISGNPTSYSATLYSTCDPNLDSELPQTYPDSVYVPAATWNQVNYLLNHDSGAYFYDVQLAIWTIPRRVNPFGVFARPDGATSLLSSVYQQ